MTPATIRFGFVLTSTMGFFLSKKPQSHWVASTGPANSKSRQLLLIMTLIWRVLNVE